MSGNNYNTGFIRKLPLAFNYSSDVFFCCPRGFFFLEKMTKDFHFTYFSSLIEFGIKMRFE